ncbi:MAG: ABC transporter permease [Chloroflexota bacterium]
MAVAELPGAPHRGSFAGFAAAYEHAWLLYRRTWRGSIFGNFAQPVLFLVAMGMGLGAYVDKGAGASALGGVSYLQFLAPALLVSTVMQGAVFEATFPILAGFHWVRRFHAMYATPLGPFAIAAAQLAWIATRATLVGTIFCVVIIGFGAAATPGIVLVIPVGTLTAFAFAAPIAAYMATQRDTSAFNSIWRFGITPLFLFSGTFFPIDRLPDFLQPVAWILPLWHGVDLGRALALGTVMDNLPLQIAHVVILLAVAVAGIAATFWSFRRRLQV